MPSQHENNELMDKNPLSQFEKNTYYLDVPLHL